MVHSRYAFALNSEGRAIVHPDRSLMGTKENPADSLLEASDPVLQQIAGQMVAKKSDIERVHNMANPFMLPICLYNKLTGRSP